MIIFSNVIFSSFHNFRYNNRSFKFYYYHKNWYIAVRCLIRTTIFFFFLTHDLSMTLKVIEGHKSSFNFDFPPQIVWISLSLFLSLKVPLLLHLMQIYWRFLPCFPNTCCDVNVLFLILYNIWAIIAQGDNFSFLS